MNKRPHLFRWASVYLTAFIFAMIVFFIALQGLGSDNAWQVLFQGNGWETRY